MHRVPDFTDGHVLKDLPPFRHKDYTGIYDMERLLSRDGFIFETDLPFRGFHEPHDGFIVVDFPAPFAPIRVTISLQEQRG